MMRKDFRPCPSSSLSAADEEHVTSTSGSRLFTVYVVASLVPVVVLGFFVNRMIDREIDQRALAEAVARTRTLADGSIEPALDGQDLDGGISDDERVRLVRATGALHGDAGVVRLRVRA